MIRRQKRFQGESAAYRINDLGIQVTASFKDTADFFHRVRKRINRIKDQPTGSVQVDLVSCNQGSERERIALYEIDSFLVETRFIVWLEIKPFEPAISKLQVIGPERKDFVAR